MNWFTVLTDELIIFEILKPDQYLHKLLLFSLVNKHMHTLVKETAASFQYSSEISTMKSILDFINDGYRMISLTQSSRTVPIQTLHYIVNVRIDSRYNYHLGDQYNMRCQLITNDGVILGIYFYDDRLEKFIEIGNMSNTYVFPSRIRGTIRFITQIFDRNIKTKILKPSSC